MFLDMYACWYSCTHPGRHVVIYECWQEYTHAGRHVRKLVVMYAICLAYTHGGTPIRRNIHMLVGFYECWKSCTNVLMLLAIYAGWYVRILVCMYAC
jgi:hypothetical protein